MPCILIQIWSYGCQDPKTSCVTFHKHKKGEMNLWPMEINQQLPYGFLTYSLSIVKSKYFVALHKYQNQVPLFS